LGSQVLGVIRAKGPLGLSAVDYGSKPLADEWNFYPDTQNYYFTHALLSVKFKSAQAYVNK
jgi:hypothetical protein